MVWEMCVYLETLVWVIQCDHAGCCHGSIGGDSAVYTAWFPVCAAEGMRILFSALCVPDQRPLLSCVSDSEHRHPTASLGWCRR